MSQKTRMKKTFKEMSATYTITYYGAIIVIRKIVTFTKRTLWAESHK